MNNKTNVSTGTGQTIIGNIVSGDKNKVESTQKTTLNSASNKLSKLEKLLLKQAKILEIGESDIKDLKGELDALKEELNDKPLNKETIWSKVESISKAFSWAGPIMKLFIEKFIF